MEDDISIDMANLSVEGEEDEGVVIEGKEIVEDGIDCSMCLVGRFHSERNINFNAMKHTLASLWRPFMGVTIHEEEDDTYLFQFYHEVDVNRVMEMSPWTFDNQLLLLERMDDYSHPSEVHGLRSGFMSEHATEKIDNALGELVESDPKNYDKPKKKFMRLRYRQDVGGTMEVGDESMQNRIGRSGMSEVQNSNGRQKDKEGADSASNDLGNSKIGEVMDVEGGGDLAGEDVGVTIINPKRRRMGQEPKKTKEPSTLDNDASSSVLRTLEEWRLAHASDTVLGIPATKTVCWQPPEVGWLKVNVDAATGSNSNFMAAAVVVRDSNSRFIAAKSWRFLGRFSAKSAEANAISEVLSWVKLQNWDRVIIESDAKILVQAINDDSYEDSSSFGLLVCDCKSLLNDIIIAKSNFGFRSGNSATHVLTTSTLFTSGLGEWFEIPPHFIVEVLALE
ncbi:hypothetical protein K2173_003893 [Erythroxylum novogranatense]|uniref:DUF4283 domain-containing protein n=1 Tax=Erythroxylum novogranatense TaxID=1862640 RepID=A0AAV8SJ13_9ROSI|nr:hypothetical protein K2173_003893 [Erythroxylum novogranatense]